MVFGFFRSDYWIIAIILTTIYCTFVFSVYITTQTKVNDPLNMREHVDAGGEYGGEGHELELSGIRNISESIIEEHEVIIFLQLILTT
jgi:hypothetical protein